MEAIQTKYDKRIEAVNDGLKASILKHLNPTLETKLFDLDHRMKLFKDEVETRLDKLDTQYTSLTRDITSVKGSNDQVLSTFKNQDITNKALEQRVDAY